MSTVHEECLGKLAYAWPRLDARATARSEPEDFIVEERLGFDPAGQGEHVLLHVCKRGLNTDQVARALARHADVKRVSIGFAGLKDRHAVTSQYFSVHLPGISEQAEPDWTALNSTQLKVLSATRHTRKLRRGGLIGNAFRLCLREVQGDPDVITERLQCVSESGVPNYFMDQRFGHQCNNLARADEMLLQGKRIRDRHMRGIYLSSARSWLFNLVLSARIDADNWNSALEGDSYMLDQSRSCFQVDNIDETLQTRLARLEVHPTGPLWGRGRSLVDGRTAILEEQALAEWEGWKSGLEMVGLDMARRRLRMRVAGLEWTWPDSDRLELSFSLQPGSYATAVLRELISTNEPGRIA
jgi:tRNA pseudouridine13 synthase